MKPRTRRINEWSLNAASALLAAVCVYVLYRVVERCVAAAWMAYKFHGYSNDGYVPLSATTGIIAGAVVLVLVLASALLSGWAKRAEVRFAYVLSRAALWGFLLGVAMYLALGLSPWGRWS